MFEKEPEDIEVNETTEEVTENIPESDATSEPANNEEAPAAEVEENSTKGDYVVEDNNEPIVENQVNDDTVTVQPVKFTSFDNFEQMRGEENKNLDILMDVKLQLNVELGRCELPIKKVLELTRGSIIELDKVAGEPVELYANGKLIANGEVVVIDDNFGLRITSITEPEARLPQL